MRTGFGAASFLACRLAIGLFAFLGTASAAEVNSTVVAGNAAAPSAGVSTNAPAKQWSLEECLATAMATHHRRPASRFAVAMAEAQHRQALAAYWPQVSARAAYQRMDE